MSALCIYDINEWTYFAELINYMAIRCTRLIFIIDRFYKYIAYYFCHNISPQI